MACKKNAYWPALAGGSPVSGNPFPSTGKAESRLNFELLRPTGLVLYNNKYTILYSSSLLDSYYTQPDSNRAANLYITTKYMFSYIINLKCSDQYSKIIVTIIVKESFVNVNTVVVCLFTARVPQSHNNNNNNKKLQDLKLSFFVCLLESMPYK